METKTVEIPREAASLAGLPESVELDMRLVRAPSDGAGGFRASDVVVTRFAGLARARAVCVQTDGKILVAGEVDSQVGDTPLNFAVARYTSDGTLDDQFGVGGRAVIDIADTNNSVYAMTLLADGRILLAGGLLDRATHSMDFVLVRLKADGKVDPTFGTNSVAQTDFLGGSDEIALALALQPDGRIVVAGYTSVKHAEQKDKRPGALSRADYDEYFALARYDSDGQPDLSFYKGGRVVTRFAGLARARAVCVQTDGKILVAGEVDTQEGDTPLNFAVARYNSDGTLDDDFGVDGRAVIDIADTNNSVYAMTLLADGRILLAGGLLDKTTNSMDFVLVRLKADGKVDPTFGTNSVAQTDFLGGSDEVALALALQPDGRIVAAGYTRRRAKPSTQAQDASQVTHKLLALTRYLANGSPDLSFGFLGTVLADAGGDGDVALTLSSDGHIIAVGTTTRDTESYFTLVKLASPTTLYSGVLASLEFLKGKPLGVHRDAIASFVAHEAGRDPAAFASRWEAPLDALRRALSADPDTVERIRKESILPTPFAQDDELVKAANGLAELTKAVRAAQIQGTLRRNSSITTQPQHGTLETPQTAMGSGQHQPSRAALDGKAATELNAKERELLRDSREAGMASDSNNVLVDGVIPLTEATVKEFRKFVEWLLNLDLNDRQERELRQKMIDEWKENDQLSEALVKSCLSAYQAIMKANVSDQNTWRKANQPKFIAELRKEMSHNQFADALISDYDIANPPTQTASSTTDTAVLAVSGLALLGILAVAVVSSRLKKTATQATDGHPAQGSTQMVASASSPAVALPTPPLGGASALANSELAKQIQANQPVIHPGTDVMEPLKGLLELPPLDEELAKINPELAKEEQKQHHANNIAAYANIASEIHGSAMGIISNWRV